MCHEKWLRREDRGEYGRSERLWDVFHRETEGPAPRPPVAERDAEPEAAPEREREETVTRT